MGFIQKKSKPVSFKFHSQYYYLNVDVIKCFDKISHQVILEKIPLTNKYLHFIKRWVKSLIIGPEIKGGKEIAFNPTEGVRKVQLLGP